MNDEYDINHKYEENELFSLLVNISSSSETSLDRLSTSLKVFVKKYFDNKDFTKPENPKDIALNCIMKVEAILYTIYELEPDAHTEEAKLELLYYKDLILKSLIVLTNLDFFVQVLKQNSLFKDAYELREKVKIEFRMEAAKLKKNFDEAEIIKIEEIEKRHFKDIKPTDYRKVKNKNSEKQNREIEVIPLEEEIKKLSFAERFLPIRKTSVSREDERFKLEKIDLPVLNNPDDESKEEEGQISMIFKQFIKLENKEQFKEEKYVYYYFD